VSGVAPAEVDVSLGESNQPAVGDGDAVGVGTEIAQRVFRSCERAFGVDDPIVVEQKSEPSCEGARLLKRQEAAVELECAGMKGGLESGDKLAAEDPAEHFEGKEEGEARGDPAGVIRSETAGASTQWI
jgi:hypothetical protein